MEFFKIKRDIDFMKRAIIFNIISLLSFLAAVFFLVTKGLNFSIEFTGGVLVEAQYTQSANLENLRSALVRVGVSEPQVQNFGTSKDVLLRLAVKESTLPALSEHGKLNVHKLTTAVLSQGGTEVTIKRIEFIGPQVGGELASDGAIALGLVIIGIMIYLAIRFEWKFAVAAIVANLHDVVIILGFFAFFQWEFSLSVLAAVLAVLGYSVNESVVVFDRIREVFRKVRGLSVSQVVNRAITGTISRTMITHGSTQLMVTSMLIFGGPALHYFALALTIGICFGIYSSVLVASPLVIWLGISREDLIKSVKKETGELLS